MSSLMEPRTLATEIFDILKTVHSPNSSVIHSRLGPGLGRTMNETHSDGDVKKKSERSCILEGESLQVRCRCRS